MNTNKKMLILYVVLAVFIFFIVIGIAARFVKKNTNETTKDEYITTAIIFYPDERTTIEGPVDKFSWGSEIIKVTINGVEYITSSENVIITRSKSFSIKKEEK